MSKRKRPKHGEPERPPDPPTTKRVYFLFGKGMTIEQMAAEIDALYAKHFGAKR